jgi:hypothetical protein
MDPSNPPKLNSEERTVKKAYAKPTVQVYGNLAQLSGTSTDAGHNIDGGGPPPVNNRT